MLRTPTVLISSASAAKRSKVWTAGIGQSWLALATADAVSVAIARVLACRLGITTSTDNQERKERAAIPEGYWMEPKPASQRTIQRAGGHVSLSTCSASHVIIFTTRSTWLLLTLIMRRICNSLDHSDCYSTMSLLDYFVALCCN